MEDTEQREGTQKLEEVGDVQKIVDNYQEDVENVKFPDKLDDIEKILDKLKDTQ